MGEEWTPTYSDADFRERWEWGDRWVRHVAEYLASRGHAVTVGESSFRETAAEIQRYTRTDVDLVMDYRYRIEVKARSCRFTCAGDFPYDPVLVSTVRAFDGKARKAHAFVIVSTATGAMVWFAAVRARFEITRQPDPRRGIRYPAYTIARRFLRDFAPK